MKKLLFAMMIGAGLAWLFDPDNGSSRRETVRKKFEGSGLSGASAANDAPTTLRSTTTPTPPVASIP